MWGRSLEDELQNSPSPGLYLDEIVVLTGGNSCPVVHGPVTIFPERLTDREIKPQYQLQYRCVLVNLRVVSERLPG